MESNKKRTIRHNVGVHIPSSRVRSASGWDSAWDANKRPTRVIDFAGYYNFGVRMWQPFLPKILADLSEGGHHTMIRPEREIPFLQKTVFSPTFKENSSSSGVIPAPTRHAILINDDVRIFVKYLRPEDMVKEETANGPHIRKNTDRHEILFIHQGRGFFETVLGVLRYRSGAYAIMPKGIEYRIVAEEFSSFLIFELKDYPYPAHYADEESYRHSPHYSFSDLLVELPELTRSDFAKEKTRVMHISDKGAEKHFYDSSPFATVAWSGQYYPYMIGCDAIRELPFAGEEESFDRFLSFAAVDESGRATSLMYTIRRPVSRSSFEMYEDAEYDTLWFPHRRMYDDSTEHKEGDLILYPRGNLCRLGDHAADALSVVLKTRERLSVAQGFGVRAEREGAKTHSACRQSAR